MVHSMVPHAKVSTAQPSKRMVRPHSWAKWEKPAKNEIEKIRETYWSYLILACVPKHEILLSITYHPAKLYGIWLAHITWHNHLAAN